MVQGLAHKAGLLLLACVAATLFVASSVWLLWHGEAVRYDAARRAAVTTHLDDIRLALQSALDARLAFLRAVAASAASDPDITPARFDAFAAALMQGTTDIRSLQLARDAVVSHVYPLAGNAGVLGLDLARDLPYAQRAALAATLDAGRTVVSGPVALLQGGRGFIARMPVMAATAPGAPLRRWGLAAIVIDVDAFFRETGLPGNGDVQVAVRDQGQDGGCVLVFGEPAVFTREPVTTSMAFPGGVWELAATPRGGFAPMPVPRAMLAAAAFAWLGLAAAFFLLASWPARLSRAVARATAALDAANAGLERTVAARTEELTQVNAALRQVEAHHRAFLDATSDMVFLKDASLRHVVVNTRFAAFCGKTPGEVVGHTDFELLPADLAARCHESDVAVRDGREVVTLLESQGERTFEVRKFPAFFGNGDVGVGGSMRDVSDRLRAEQALRQSEATLRSLYDNAPVGIFASSPDGRYLRANDRLARMYGYGGAAAFLAAVTDIGSQVYADPAEREAMLQALATRDHLSNYEVRRLTRSGDVIWVSLSIRAVRDASGEIALFEGFCTDITTRKLAEEHLAKRENQLRIIFDNSPLGLVFFDEAGVVRNCNARLLQLLGTAPEQIIGHNVRGRMPPYVRDALDRAIGGAPATAEGPYTSISGKFCHVRAIFNPVEPGRAPTPVIASVEDIGPLREREASLRLLWAAVEQSPASIVITDPKGTIEYVNPHFSILTGYTPEEAKGQNPRLLKSDVHPDDFYRQMWETLAAGEIWRGELCNRKKNGDLYWENCSISPVRDDAGTVTHYVAVKEDISERRKLERVREDVERIMRHDLKAPLNSIVNLPGLVRVVGTVNEEQEELLAEIERAGQSMFEQIELSLDMYKMETGTYALEAQRIDLAHIVAGAADMLAGMAAARGVALVVAADAPVFATGNALLCRTIAANLIKNAVEAETEGGRVDVRVEAPDGGALLTVANPTPVPPDIVPVFFEKYATAGKKDGSGLGAYSARLMTRCQHGDIRLETDAESGTRLTVSLPGAAPRPRDQ